ncbi:MAG: site-specific integrase [Aquamicrobium sp.]|uniref:tyrosine-type recombinase/integrase n=1 Tax=Aquamicrobium sp. TaxID=1872579 RepID=UPI00349EAC88|nr:site-specific integrase [Aquamicrobium sp.]
MASVRKLKPNDPNSPWVVEYTDADGKRRRATPKSGLKKDADKLRREIEAELDSGVHVARMEGASIREVAEQFMQQCEFRHHIGDLAGNTLRSYRGGVRRVVADLGDRQAHSITTDAAQEWIDSLRSTMKPRTIRWVYISLNMLLSFAVKKKWLKRNILRDDPARLPKLEKRKEIPSRENLTLLLKQAFDESLDNQAISTRINQQIILTLGAFGGLRPGEILGLRWEDVDLDCGSISIRHTLSRFDGLKCPKTEAGEREIPITHPIRAALMNAARHRAIVNQARAPGHKSYVEATVMSRIARWWKNPDFRWSMDEVNGWVWANDKGQERHREHYMRTAFDNMMKKAKLVDGETGRRMFTPHALRHAAVSLLIDAGLPVMNVSKMIGHTRVSTTLDIYAHLFPDDDRISTAAHAVAATFDATKTRLIDVTS